MFKKINVFPDVHKELMNVKLNEFSLTGKVYSNVSDIIKEALAFRRKARGRK